MLPLHLADMKSHPLSIILPFIFSFPLINKLKIAKTSFINVKNKKGKAGAFESVTEYFAALLNSQHRQCFAWRLLRPSTPLPSANQNQLQQGSTTPLLSRAGCLFFCLVFFLFSPLIWSTHGFWIPVQCLWTLWTGSEPPSRQTLKPQSFMSF